MAKKLPARFKFPDPEIDRSKKIVSYSQFSLYRKCPRQWELAYVKKKRKNDPSIHLAFGNAMHETLQMYLETVYNVSVKQANFINLENEFMEKFQEALQKETEKADGDWSWTSPEEMAEFYMQAEEILHYFRRNRTGYFTTKQTMLIGCEIPLYFQVLEDIPVNFLGYIDLALLDLRDESVLIEDFKTSTWGWKSYEKKDKAKTNQILLYKGFLRRILKDNEIKIDGEYLILKRKLYDFIMYPQKRIQVFKPAQSDRTVNKVLETFYQFVEDNFDQDGQYKDFERQAIAGPDGFNCKFCDFKDNEELCPFSKRKASY